MEDSRQCRLFFQVVRLMNEIIVKLMFVQWFTKRTLRCFFSCRSKFCALSYATTRHRFGFFMGPFFFMIALAWLCMLYYSQTYGSWRFHKTNKNDWPKGKNNWRELQNKRHKLNSFCLFGQEYLSMPSNTKLIQIYVLRGSTSKVRFPKN